jgi:hypothetical protein
VQGIHLNSIRMITIITFIITDLYIILLITIALIHVFNIKKLFLKNVTTHY